ncbi:MAG: hypothetical protein HOV94_11205 [Saccharothrix sp.]|nr:hypothetical protein [Saccharothrix sp.]
MRCGDLPHVLVLGRGDAVEDPGKLGVQTRDLVDGVVQVGNVSRQCGQRRGHGGQHGSDTAATIG